MSVWCSAEVKCNNPDVVKAFALSIRDEDNIVCQGWKAGDTEVSTGSHWHPPYEWIEEVSRQFPDDVIICRYDYDIEENGPWYILEYCNGKKKAMNIEPNYYFSGLSLHNDWRGIYDKAVAFCRRLDTTETDEDGLLFLKWFNEEVCYKFEYNNEDGKKYQIAATKLGQHIDFKIYENSGKDDWREITSREAPDAEPPL